MIALTRAAKAGISAKAMLADNDPWTFFNAIGDLLVTGPKLTNVNGFRAVLIEKGCRPSRAISQLRIEPGALLFPADAASPRLCDLTLVSAPVADFQA